MSLKDMTLRLNLDTEDIEVVVDDKVVDSVGKDVVDSWFNALGEKRKANKEAHNENNLIVETVPAVVPDAPKEPVEDAAVEVPAETPEEVSTDS